MATNHKFGNVTLENPGQIKDNEPVFILAAHDKHTVAMIMDYHEAQRLSGASPEFLNDLVVAAQEIEHWQMDNELLDPRGV